MKGKEAIYEYFGSNKARQSRPSEDVLNFFEDDPGPAQLTIHQKTGFDLDNVSKPLDKASRNDEVTRNQAPIGIEKSD